MKFPLDAIVCRTALSLFRNISANDILKTRLLQEGGLRLVLGCMSQHKDDKSLQVWFELACFEFGPLMPALPSVSCCG